MRRREFLRRAATATKRSARFPLGRVSTTHSAFKRLHALGLESSDLIARHQVGDWGDVDDRDRETNEEGMCEEQRFLSLYKIEKERFWVLTAADRSRTWILTTVKNSRTKVFVPGNESPDPSPVDS